MEFSCGMIRTFHVNVILAPTFDGCLDPWTLITWLSKMNQFFDQVDLSYIKKGLVCQDETNRRARDYWHNLRR